MKWPLRNLNCLGFVSSRLVSTWPLRVLDSLFQTTVNTVQNEPLITHVVSVYPGPTTIITASTDLSLSTVKAANQILTRIYSDPNYLQTTTSSNMVGPDRRTPVVKIAKRNILIRRGFYIKP